MTIPDLFLVILANIAWGLNFIAGKQGAAEFQPLFFTSLRFLILLCITLPWLKPAKGYMIPMLRVAFMLGVVHFSMMFIGLNAGANITSVAVVCQLYVPFATVLAAVFLREKISILKISAILIALGGVMLISFDPTVFNHIDAVLWVTGAALAMAIATILMRQCPNLGVLKLQAWIAAVATPSLFLLSLIFEKNHLELVAQSSLLSYWSPAYSAIGASIIGHGIVYRLLGRYPVSIVSPFLLLAPVLASIFGVILLGDVLGWKLVTGGTITLVGVCMVSIEPKYLLGGRIFNRPVKEKTS